ncbi:hypothetical protein [Cohaesibacter celericrescens]|uniref:ThuA-like domain-containing protein n=1 Tax=Cohaesibacter celericrescens TaxID=2067669 RepID=A0A2N5XQB7_9HYPH|nr:hypothetical protein [Cohaesibacter celericrescens]PLW76618.1 hypothetical protein C0081_13795 [Cohaesibacter celericrescens]
MSTVPAGRFLFLKNTAGGLPAFFPKLAHHNFDIIQQYEADRLDWSHYDAIILTTHSDQRHLMELSNRFNAYLEQGGTILFNGHVVQAFLPELSFFKPLPKRGKFDLVVHREKEHPAFDGIDSNILSFRKGVSGFYGRGMNPPPQGAEILNSVGPDHWPLDWIATRPSGGRIFMHAGNDIWGFLMIGSSQNLPLVQRFFDWLSASSNQKPATQIV